MAVAGAQVWLTAVSAVGMVSAASQSPDGHPAKAVVLEWNRRESGDVRCVPQTVSVPAAWAGPAAGSFPEEACAGLVGRNTVGLACALSHIR